MIYNTDFVVPGVGVGYRSHTKYHGYDLSLHYAGIPAGKVSYLNYPLGNDSLYLGVGAFLVPIPIPTFTLGVSVPVGNVTFFFQGDLSIVVVGCLSVGIGF